MSHGLCKTVDALLPLYTLDGNDQAESILGAYPDAIHIVEAAKILIDVMLPGRMTSGAIERDEFGIFIMRRLSQAWRTLRPELERAIPFRWNRATAKEGGQDASVDARQESVKVMNTLYRRLPEVRKRLIEDVKAAYEGDPAALSYAEVKLAYPGLLAVVSHRIAHELYLLNVPLVPRIISEWTHAKTGVDIHPGARVGHGLFIDHATGVVIGETTIIGNHVKIYQSVTLGAKSFPLDENGLPIKHIKRHPTVGDRVVLYANSTILGDITIGPDSTVGGNVFLTEDVPPNSFVASKHPELHIKEVKE